MSYEFTKLSDVTLVDTPASSANVLIEEGGTVKKVPKAEVGTKLSDATLVSTPAPNANVLIEESGVLKKVSKAEIGAQADWDETDETSPAFILNKPELGGGSKVTYLFAHSGAVLGFNSLYDVKNPNTPLTFQEAKNALTNGVVRFCSDASVERGCNSASSIIYYSTDESSGHINLAYYAESSSPGTTAGTYSEHTYAQPNASTSS